MCEYSGPSNEFRAHVKKKVETEDKEPPKKEKREPLERDLKVLSKTTGSPPAPTFTPEKACPKPKANHEKALRQRHEDKKALLSPQQPPAAH